MHAHESAGSWGGASRRTRRSMSLSGPASPRASEPYRTTPRSRSPKACWRTDLICLMSSSRTTAGVSKEGQSLSARSIIAPSTSQVTRKGPRRHRSGSGDYGLAIAERGMERRQWRIVSGKPSVENGECRAWSAEHGVQSGRLAIAD